MFPFALACVGMMALRFPPVSIEEIFETCHPPEETPTCEPGNAATTSSILLSTTVKTTNSSMEPTTAFSTFNSSSTTAPTSTSTSTTTPSIPSTTSPLLPPMAMNISGCGCNVTTLYLDIMLVISTTNDLRPTDLQAITAYIETVVYEMTLGQRMEQVTRIGLVVYSEDARLVFPLSEFKSTEEFLEKFEIPIIEQKKDTSNLYRAIYLAKEELDVNGRKGFRPVILIITQTYHDHNVDPSNIASAFKLSGVIITIQYFANHGTEGELLSELSALASPHYNLSNKYESLHAAQLHHLFCQANCFCPTYWLSYKADDWESPTNGCYHFDTKMVATYLDAQTICRSENGVLASIEDKPKAEWLQKNQSLTITEQWIGLVCDRLNCTWDDLTKFEFNLLDAPLNSNSSQLCAKQTSVDQVLVWKLIGCSTESLNFTCEKKACASDHFCYQSTKNSFDI